MILVGAKGHAKEVYQVLSAGEGTPDISFFDDVSEDLPSTLHGCPIVRSLKEAEEELRKDDRFVLALGGVQARRDLYAAFRDIGGEPKSIISGNAFVGQNADLSDALNIMAFATVYNSAEVATGTLVNSYASIHHDSVVGAFAEISPGARVLGRSKVGAYTSIGSNATVLPDVSVGDRCVVGAGAVVTRDVQNGEKVVGVPAVPIEKADGR